jgi:diguanylate cyclase (GGDEF)-like protein
MRLTTRFLLLRAVVFVTLGVLVWLSFDAVVDRINMQWGREFAQRQVLFDKYRTLSPLIREIELARKMAAEPALIGMALNEHDPLARKRGLQVLEEYRYRFREHSYFAAFAHSGNYYYNDAGNTYAGKQLRYTLNSQSVNDQWFYATLKDGMEYQVNVDPDVHLDVVKVWINVLLKQRGKVMGVVGTGIELTDFLKESVDIHQPGVDNFFVDKSLAIQLSTDPAMIDYASLTKSVEQRIRIDRLFTRPADMAAIQRTAEALRSKPDGEIATLWVNYQGGRHLLGMAWLPELGWYDLTLMDEQSLTMLHEYSWVPMLFVMLFLAALMLFGWLFNRWALKPICSLNEAMQAIQDGDDRLEPPIGGKGEVEALSRSFRQMVEKVRNTNQELEAKVKERTEALQRLSEIDPLTGLLNRRGMMARFEQELARQTRQDGTLGLLLLDLDHFKEVNDRYGHAAGDLALCATARALGGVMRAYDHAARWGGEEFFILLPDCSEIDLLTIAERIRARVAALKIDTGQHTFSFTVSIGAYLPHTMQTPDAMLQQVDRALYAAKADGRDCVRLAKAEGAA